jgi:hypothetical protein
MRRDQDAAAALRLLAARLAELRAPLLAALRAALPTVGDGLAAVVQYGAAHVYMSDLYKRAAGAAARADAARAALERASAAEMTATAAGASAAAAADALQVDHARLCRLAGGPQATAASWLGRHEHTLLALAPSSSSILAHSSSSSSSSSSSNHHAAASTAAAAAATAIAAPLAAPDSEWDPSCGVTHKPLLLLTSFSCSGSTAAAGNTSEEGLLQLGLAQLGGPGTAQSGCELAAALLPAPLRERCVSIDSRGSALLLRLAQLMRRARWALACYSLLLQNLLSGESCCAVLCCSA